MKSRFNPSRVVILAMFATLSALPIACGGAGGGGVEGHTYVGNGSVVKIEFKAGGKAFVATGPISTECTYSESGKAVALTCVGDKTEFTVDADGALIGPPGGMMARLTKQQ
jgi:hypothetical protein